MNPPLCSLLALALLSAPPALAASEEPPGLEGELGVAVTSWDACEDAKTHGRYFLGRYAHKQAVIEVASGSTAALTRLWTKAKPGGLALTWPGGRLGVRHVELKEGKSAVEATSVAAAGRLFIWEAINGWGNNLGQITGVELAKSLCDASTLVVYVTLKVDLPGEGYLIASILPPDEATDPMPTSADPPRAVVAQLYAEMLQRLHAALKIQKLAPADVTLALYPGHFTGEALEYLVSMRGQTRVDERFSLVCRADETGKTTRVIDKQEGGAGGLAVGVAALADGKTEDVIYELSTMEGSSAALWSLKQGKLTPLVRTTPVGE